MTLIYYAGWWCLVVPIDDKLLLTRNCKSLSLSEQHISFQHPSQKRTALKDDKEHFKFSLIYQILSLCQLMHMGSGAWKTFSLGNWIILSITVLELQKGWDLARFAQFMLWADFENENLFFSGGGFSCSPSGGEKPKIELFWQQVCFQILLIGPRAISSTSAIAFVFIRTPSHSTKQSPSFALGGGSIAYIQKSGHILNF